MSEAVGEVGKEGKVLIVRSIHVTYHLKIEPSQRETAERVLGFHADFCPMARSIRGCVAISTALSIEDLPAA